MVQWRLWVAWVHRRESIDGNGAPFLVPVKPRWRKNNGEYKRRIREGEEENKRKKEEIRKVIGEA